MTFGDAPDPAWLGAYHYLGGSLSDVAVDVLRGAGFTRHHHYRYHGPPPAGAPDAAPVSDA